jgi:hypothetical protein
MALRFASKSSLAYRLAAGAGASAPPRGLNDAVFCIASSIRSPVDHLTHGPDSRDLHPFPSTAGAAPLRACTAVVPSRHLHATPVASGESLPSAGAKMGVSLPSLRSRRPTHLPLSLRRPFALLRPLSTAAAGGAESLDQLLVKGKNGAGESGLRALGASCTSKQGDPNRLARLCDAGMPVCIAPLKAFACPERRAHALLGLRSD